MTNNTDDTAEESDTTDINIGETLRQMERIFRFASEELRDGMEQAEAKRRRRRSPFERAAESARKRVESVRIEVEDELASIKSEQNGTDVDETAPDSRDEAVGTPIIGGGGFEFPNPPADARHCPSCGVGLEGKHTHFHEDQLLNRYRTQIECPSCGFGGEVIRHSIRNDSGE